MDKVEDAVRSSVQPYLGRPNTAATRHAIAAGIRDVLTRALATGAVQLRHDVIVGDSPGNKSLRVEVFCAEPRWRHPPCSKCIFLGRATHADTDLYFCSQGGRPTVIARRGDAPEDYVSGIAFSAADPAVEQACFRARTRGLLPALESD